MVTAYVALAVAVVTLVLQCLLGGTFIIWAPMVAERFYPRHSETPSLQPAIGPGDLYRTACFVLGAYLLVRAAELAAVLACAGFAGTLWQVGQAADVARIVIYVASGVVLVFGSRQIGEMLSSFRHDSNAIPNQQFSVKMIIAFLVILAVILGVVRIIIRGRM